VRGGCPWGQLRRQCCQRLGAAGDTDAVVTAASSGWEHMWCRVWAGSASPRDGVPSPPPSPCPHGKWASQPLVDLVEAEGLPGLCL
jgi:hypothetical protein